ncbi:MAG: hypothetical protein ACW98X_11080 [Promethearchaeota archaeon]|jgi:hypothetical protein
MSLTKVNNLVAEFCKQNGMADTAEKWMETSYQKQLKKLTIPTVKKEKDENAPKRSKSTYLYFCNHERAVVNKLHPEMQATKVTTELGIRWKALNTDESTEAIEKLNKFKQMAEEDKKRYIDEKSKYDPPAHLKGPKKGPKKSKSSYMFFCDKNRAIIVASNKDLKTTEITKLLGKQWSNLKEDVSKADELESYTVMAEEDKQRYLKQKQEFVSEDPNELKSNKKYSSSSSQQSQKKSTANGYHLFCEENRPQVCKEFPEASPKDITGKMAAMWKSMTKQEREVYNTKASK